MRFVLFSLILVFVLIFGCASQEQKTETKQPTTPPPSPAPEPAPLPQPVPEPTPSPQPAAGNQQPIPQPAPSPEPSPTPAPEPQPLPEPAPTPQPPPPPAPKIINGKTLSERMQEASDRLHTQGSGQHARDDFPDMQLVYTDNAQGTGFPEMILPFRYYYSEEANKTFNICNIDLTVFICKGKLDKLITKEDIDSGRCEVTQVYQDPRAGGSGGQGYRYGN